MLNPSNGVNDNHRRPSPFNRASASNVSSLARRSTSAWNRIASRRRGEWGRDRLEVFGPVGQGRQALWVDVLEHGKQSKYAKYFDIAWNGSPRPYLQDKVLLPVLGEPYGDALEKGQIRAAELDAARRDQLLRYPNDHIKQWAGNARHVGIGSDLDGGYGREQTPADVETIADLARLPRLLSARGYSEPDISLIMHGNWIRFLQEAWRSK